jgi:predicted nucleic acid-binding protein
LKVYLDASVLVASLTNEVRTEDARDLIRAREPLDIGFSSWTLVEALSGLSRKVRTGHLTAKDFDAVSHQVRAFPNAHARAPVGEEHFLAAMKLVGRRELKLRAGDALHLAIASDFGLTLATFDSDLAAAAQAVGVPVT